MKQITSKTKGVRPIGEENLEGKILILDAKVLSPKYRTAQNQLWKATGGFGCDANLRGTTIFCTALADKENARWDRSQFIGIVDENFAQQIFGNVVAE